MCLTEEGCMCDYRKDGVVRQFMAGDEAQWWGTRLT
jgi:hypothetical protein